MISKVPCDGFWLLIFGMKQLMAVHYIEVLSLEDLVSGRDFVSMPDARRAWTTIAAIQEG